MTRDSAWVLGQFALAWVLVVASAAGLIVGASGFPALLFWAVLPGAALSFVVNGLVMRRHGEHGLAGYEKIGLVLQVVVLGALAAIVLGSVDGSFLGMLYGVPFYVIFAGIVLAMAVERNWHLHPRDSNDDDVDADPAEPIDDAGQAR